MDDRDKDEFLGNAYAYPCPMDWPEPFVLTMVEAMVCGTSVIAMRCGPVPEVVANGVSGFICDQMQDFIDAVPRAATLDRATFGPMLRRVSPPPPCRMATKWSMSASSPAVIEVSFAPRAGRCVHSRRLKKRLNLPAPP